MKNELSTFYAAENNPIEPKSKVHAVWATWNAGGYAARGFGVFRCGIVRPACGDGYATIENRQWLPLNCGKAA